MKPILTIVLLKEAIVRSRLNNTVSHQGKVMRKIGKIVSWKSEKGFGFIEPSNGGQHLFVHIRAIDRSLLPPSVGVEVSYIESADAQGRLRADKVEPSGKGIRLGEASKALISSTAFFFVIAGICALGFLPFGFLWFYLAVSGITFFVYAHDKSAAESHSRRTPEETLHVLALIGGWPGALYAQQLLRHKSRKQSFRAVWWATVAANIVILVCIVLEYDLLLLELIRKIP